MDTVELPSSSNGTSPDTVAPLHEKRPLRHGWSTTAATLLAWLTSLAAHVGALLMLATVTLLTPIDSRLQLLSTPPVPEEEPLEDAFRVSEELSIDVGALSDGGTGDAAAAAPLEATLSAVSLDLEALTEKGELPTFELAVPVLTSPDPDDQLLVKGVGAIGATGSRGAVDRITGEILLSLDQRPTLVVWLFDRSASLSGQREEIVSRFDRIYDELGVAAGLGNQKGEELRHDDQPLLTAITAFGAGIDFLTPKPTDLIEEVKTAVRSVSEDASGEENVFGALLTVSEKYRRYRLHRPRRNVMLIVVTDEAGDDPAQLDRCVTVLRKMQMPVYVVGSPAPFGRLDAYVRYVDPNPKYDQSPQWLPVRQGPESLLPERLKLGAIGRGDFDGPTIDSGFGPFGLTRLATETGGFYIAVHPFRVDAGQARRRGRKNAMASEIDYFFDTRLMRRYRPDYVTVAEYRRRLSSNRARSALVEAATKSWTTPLENIRREFPKIDEAQLAEDLTRAQRAAAILEPALADLVATLRRGERDRPDLESPRWQAGFDLAMGRALASKVRAEGYNTMLAQAKQGMSFENTRNDTWVLRPSREISTGSVAAGEAEQATVYLTRVTEEHAGTPWALLAQRELKQPLGWQWKEAFRNVAERVAEAEEAERRPEPDMPPPEPRRRLPPKL